MNKREMKKLGELIRWYVSDIEKITTLENIINERGCEFCKYYSEETKEKVKQKMKEFIKPQEECYVTIVKKQSIIICKKKYKNGKVKVKTNIEDKNFYTLESIVETIEQIRSIDIQEEEKNIITKKTLEKDIFITKVQKIAKIENVFENPDEYLSFYNEIKNVTRKIEDSMTKYRFNVYDIRIMNLKSGEKAIVFLKKEAHATYVYIVTKDDMIRGIAIGDIIGETNEYTDNCNIAEVFLGDIKTLNKWENLKFLKEEDIRNMTSEMIINIAKDSRFEQIYKSILLCKTSSDVKYSLINEINEKRDEFKDEKKAFSIYPNLKHIIKTIEADDDEISTPIVFIEYEIDGKVYKRIERFINLAVRIYNPYSKINIDYLLKAKKSKNLYKFLRKNLYGKDIIDLMGIENVDDKLLEYIENLPNKNALHEEKAQMLYRDYLRMAKDLGMDLSDKDLLKPHPLTYQHDRICYIYNQKKIQIESEKYESIRNKYKKLEFSYGNKTVIVPREVQDIVHEGVIMHNCIASYAKSMLTEKTIIMFVKDKGNLNGNSLYDIELSTKTYRIKQIEGKSATKVKRQDKAFIEMYKNHLENVYNKENR